MAELRPFRQTFMPGNALMERERFQRERAQENRANVLFQEGQEDRLRNIRYDEEDRATAEKTRKLTQTAKALQAALTINDPKMQKQVYDYFKDPDSETPEFDFKGGIMTIRYPDGEEITGPVNTLIELTKQIETDPTWLTDPNKARHTVAWLSQRQGSIKFPQEGMEGVGNTEKERSWLRETGGKIPMSQWEIGKKVAEDRARQRLSDREQERYDRYDKMAFDAEKEVKKLKSELSVFKEREDESAYVKQKRQLLRDFEEEAKYYREKATEIIDQTKPTKPKGAGKFEVPKATLDYWRKRGKTDEEIYKEYERVHGKNPPKIGY